MNHKIAVIGAGGWGTALAVMWQRAEKDVTLWTAFEEESAEIKQFRENKRYLPGVLIPENLTVTSDAESALDGSEIVVFVVPSKYLGKVAKQLKEFIPTKARIISATKGLAEETIPPLRMTQVLQNNLCVVPERIVALSGPSHAEEVGRGIPTTIVMAGKNVEELREFLSTEIFRIYTSDDVIGVELGGTLKNPIAIAAGIGKGLGAGDNALGALVTRGIAEVTRLGVAAGAREKTFAGLSGIGDLVTTCISEHSRNRRVGIELAKGRKISDILSSLGMVAEGVETARSASKWAESLGVETPIISAVKSVIFDNKSPKEELQKLMTRTLKHEFE